MKRKELQQGVGWSKKVIPKPGLGNNGKEGKMGQKEQTETVIVRWDNDLPGRVRVYVPALDKWVKFQPNGWVRWSVETMRVVEVAGRFEEAGDEPRWWNREDSYIGGVLVAPGDRWVPVNMVKPLMREGT